MGDFRTTRAFADKAGNTITEPVEPKPVKIKTKGNQFISVPNNEEGQEFLRLLSKFANHKRFRVRKKGRGGNRKALGGNQYDIPLKHAEWIAIYVDDKQAPENRREEYQRQRHALDVARESGVKDGIQIGKQRVADRLSYMIVEAAK
jgi:hypothetical protein